MSARIEIKPGEHGIVRVFAVDLAASGLKQFNRRNGNWPLREALGAELLEPGQIELFAVSDLEGVGLAGYLEEGLGIDTAQIDEMRPQLDALKGAVLVVRSRAFGGQAQVLSPAAPLRLVGTFTEAESPVSFRPLPGTAAEGVVTGPAKAPPSDAAMSGRVAMVALLVLFVLVAVMVWIA